MVDVTLALDAAPRRVDVPAALQHALKAKPKAAARFAALSYSRQRVLVDPIARAKTAETRDRNIAKGLAALLAKD
jgi:uncharacterized protein YdeI (YjbR/CyaY-like superfamily)